MQTFLPQIAMCPNTNVIIVEEGESKFWETTSRLPSNQRTSSQNFCGNPWNKEQDSIW